MCHPRSFRSWYAAAVLACLSASVAAADKWISVDKKTGQGIFVWDSGARYTGTAIKGKREGRGIITYPDGSVVEGIFVNNVLMNGHMTYPNGSKYDGDFVNEKRDGRGRHTDPQGNVFDGTFQNGQPVHGTITYPNGRKVEVDMRGVAQRQTGPAVLLDLDESRTTGQLVNGFLQGPGSRAFADGAKFEGTFKDGAMAEGSYRYANGDVYTGTFKEDLRDGSGVLVSKSGDRFDGMWRRGGFHGEGVATLQNGTSLTGTFDNGKLVKGSRTDAKGKSIAVDITARLSKLNGIGTETTERGDQYEGSFVDGLRDGQGTVVASDGSRYEGMFSKDVLVSGTLVRPSGLHYEGSFDVDLGLHGSGILQMTNGNRFEGQINHGTLAGKGIYRYASGRVMEGEWIEGTFAIGTVTDANGSSREVDMRMVSAKRSGKGVSVNADGDRYEGEFKDGKFHGIGYLKTSSGHEYTGEFSNGLLSKGRIAYADGSRYEGTNVGGKFDGYGIYRSSIGDVYEGEYKAGQRHGFGTYRWASGDYYEGWYANGTHSGKGKYVFTGENRVYEGDFVNGKFHGRGVMTWENGDRYAGEFINGERQGPREKAGGGFDGSKLFFAALGTAAIGSASGVDAMEKVRIAGGMISDMYGGTNGAGLRAASADVTQSRKLRAELARHQAAVDDLARVNQAATAQRAEAARQQHQSGATKPNLLAAAQTNTPVPTTSGAAQQRPANGVTRATETMRDTSAAAAYGPAPRPFVFIAERLFTAAGATQDAACATVTKQADNWGPNVLDTIQIALDRSGCECITRRSYYHVCSLTLKVQVSSPHDPNTKTTPANTVSK